MDRLIEILSSEFDNTIVVEDNEFLTESTKIDVNYLLKNSSIGLTDVESVIKKLKLLPTTNPVSIVNGEYTENGLFSEQIYGLVGSPERKVRMSFVDLSQIGEFLHPIMIYYFSRYSPKIYSSIISTSETVLYTYNEKSKMLEQVTDSSGTSLSGYHLVDFIVSNYKKINNLSSKLVSILEKYGRKVLTSYILILPPDLRPITKVNNLVVLDKLNDIYSSLIQYSIQYKYVSKNDIMWNTIWKNIQMKIMQLYETIVDSIHKKEGMIRNKVLSKRVDFNVASTAINDPTVSVWEIGLPYKLAVSLGFYHVLHVLMNKDSRKRNKAFISILSRYNIKTYEQISLLVKDFERDHLDDEDLIDLVKEACDIAFENKYVLYKRDPALHRDSWTAAKPVLHDDTYAIRINANAAKPLNLDYDGDSVAGDSIVTLYDENNNLLYNGQIQDLVAGGYVQWMLLH